jgi:hypothetical protein
MSSNAPFGLPGANAMGDTLEFVKNLWGSMKVPGMSMPSLSAEDIDKQIADLKAVESWLQINMNMLRSSIQALEVQSATLSALRSMGESFSKATSVPASSADDRPAFESPFSSSASVEDSSLADATPDPAALAAQFANPAVWWNAVQEQFSNAVSQAMTPVSTPSKPSPKKTTTAKTVAKKTPAKKAAAKKTAASKTATRKRASRA